MNTSGRAAKSEAKHGFKKKRKKKRLRNRKQWGWSVAGRGDWQRGGPSLHTAPQRGDAGLRRYPPLFPLIASTPGIPLPSPAHIWPVEFSDVQNSPNWFSPARHCTQTQWQV